jgi:hypothetical protein
MEVMLAEHDSPKPQEIHYEKAGPARTVGTWTCIPYRVTVNGVAHEELCLVRMSEAGLKRDDLRAFASLSSFVQEAAPPGQNKARTAAYDFDAMSKAVGFEAFPIESTSYASDGKVIGRTTVKTVERKTIAADTFEIPKGFDKKDMTAGFGK